MITKITSLGKAPKIAARVVMAEMELYDCRKRSAVSLNKKASTKTAIHTQHRMEYVQSYQTY